MDLTSTTSTRLPALAQLDLADHSWARVDIGDLENGDPHAVLTGRTPIGRFSGRADGDRELGDLVGTYWAALFLMSSKFVATLETANLTGWKPVPVEVHGNPDARNFALLQVTGTCGPISGGKVGRSLDLRTWDGSDFFVAENESVVFLSEKAAEVLRSSQLANVDISPASVDTHA